MKEKAKAEGEKEVTNQMVLNLAKEKISIKTMMTVTGLTEAEIKFILDNQIIIDLLVPRLSRFTEVKY